MNPVSLMRPHARPGRQRSPVIPLLLAASGWITLGIVAAGAPVAIRTLAVFAFILICPGAALVRLLRLRNLLEQAVLGVAIGLSLATLTIEFAALGSPAQASVVLTVLALVCTAAAVTEAVQRMRVQ